jgi:alpha-1,6-mannosyltransferase
VPTLSTDVYRYLWDGHVANAGVSPYAHAVNAPALDHLDTPFRAKVNHAWMASPYLPAAQTLFRAVTAVLPVNPLSMQLVMSLCTLASGAILAGLLGRLGLPPRRLLLYLWNPLVVIETAHGAHIDAWMTLWVLAAVALWLEPGRRAQRISSPLALALATLTKGIPVLLAPLMMGVWGLAGTALYAAVVVGMSTLFALGPGWGLTGELDGTGFFGALRIYGDQWNFNSGLFYWGQAALTAAGWEEKQAAFWAKAAGVGLLALWVARLWLTRHQAQTPRARVRRLAYPLMGYMLLTTTVHPWYILPLLAFTPLLAPGDDEPAPQVRRQLWIVAPWIYLSAALVLSYTAYAFYAAAELPWVRYVEYVPVLAAIARLTAEMLSARRPEAKMN